MKRILFVTLSKGHTRIVVHTRSKVFKIPRFHCERGLTLTNRIRIFLLGWVSNIQEREWSRLHTGARLCPVVFSWMCCFIIAMPKCKQEDVTESEVLQYLRDMNEVDSSIFGHDLRKENYGYLDGNLVKLDYGVTYNSPRLKTHDEKDCVCSL